jgi:hypothetical protein
MYTLGLIVRQSRFRHRYEYTSESLSAATVKPDSLSVRCEGALLKPSSAGELTDIVGGRFISNFKGTVCRMRLRLA